MKTFIFSFISILFAILFVGCKENSVMNEDLPLVSVVGIQVSLKTNTSPVLKDGGDDDFPEPMFFVTGMVTENGNPVQAMVELVATPESSLIDSANTDSDGGFVFYQVPSGLYNVVVIVDGDVAEAIPVNL